MRTRRRAVSWCSHLGLLLALAALPLQAQAQAGDPFDVPAAPTGQLGDRTVSMAACVRARTLVAQKAAVAACWRRSDVVAKVIAAAQSMVKDVCDAGSLPAEGPWGTAALEGAQRALAEASAARDELDAKLAGAAAALAAAAPAQKAAAQALLDALQATKPELEARLATAQAAAEAARQAFARSEQAAAARRALDGAYTQLISAASPGDFEDFLDDDGRQLNCRAINDEMLKAYARAHAGERATSTAIDNAADAEAAKDVEKHEQASETERAEAHASDLMRKSATTSSALTTGLGLLETPGAPDKVAFAVMTALGAEEETTGSQVLLTLNLASLFEPVDEKRLDLGAGWRNMFLRAALPLESTEASSIAPGTEDPGEAQDATDEAVTRFQFVLGTSLLDTADTRHDDNDPCYARVLDYLPYVPVEERDAELLELRKSLFDICNGRVAQQQRVAIRAGIGLASEDDETRSEVLAAGVVWAPFSQLYLNAIYQRVLEPEGVHNVGFGVALGDNIGGSPSGVDSWARVSVDVLCVVQIPDDTDKALLEARIVPKLLFKLGDSITSVGVGPRIVRAGQSDSDTGLLASIAVTYDADQLISPLLTPLSDPTAVATAP